MFFQLQIWDNQLWRAQRQWCRLRPTAGNSNTYNFEIRRPSNSESVVINHSEETVPRQLILSTTDSWESYVSETTTDALRILILNLKF